jgi:hypothetical protein
MAMQQSATDLANALGGFGSSEMADVGVLGFTFVMVVSLACSLFIAYLYLYFFSSTATGSEIHRAFPLLGVSVTSIFITIQFSLPLSLGLLGALSIVRFRTPVKEPEEIGFIMLVIAASIACATFNIVFLAIVLAVAVGGLLLARSGVFSASPGTAMVIVTVQGDSDGEKSDAVLRHLGMVTKNGRMESISRSGESTTISYTFGAIRSTLSEFQVSLQKILGHSEYEIFANQQQIN